MGLAAAAAATGEPVREGAVGAGTGATVGKLLGMSHAMKSGIGTATVELDGELAGIRVSALAAVNAAGDVRDPESGEILSGARTAPDSFEFIDTTAAMLSGARPGQPGENTTLVVVVTNAGLSKVEATRLAQMAGIGMARTISPVWTSVDGDLIVAASTGSKPAPIDPLGVAAAEAVAHAIVRAARLAPTLGGVPGLAR
jgi:L-aminopeptidase/D-esterase-like protein